MHEQSLKASVVGIARLIMAMTRGCYLAVADPKVYLGVCPGNPLLLMDSSNPFHPSVSPVSPVSFQAPSFDKRKSLSHGT